MHKKYQVILFDMDGTIVDTDPMLVETFNILYDKYPEAKRKTKEEIYYFSGPPIRETLQKEFPFLSVDEAVKEFYNTSYPLYFTHIFAYPHSKEVFLKLKKDGFKLGVVTNKMHDMALVALHNIDLDNIFDVVIGFDDVSRGKPDKEGICLASKMLKEDVSTALYVGDNKVDYLTAENAGIDCCLVSWGPRKLPDDIYPKYKIDSFLRLEECLYE